MKNRSMMPAILLVLFLSAGIVTQQAGLIDWFKVLELARDYAHHWWFAPLVVLVMVLFYAFAMPGSLFIWVNGMLFSPLIATAIISIGGLGGACAAYFLANRMSEGLRLRITNSPFFTLLRKNSDTISLTAIRLLPGFPHAVINYGSGILGLPLKAFIPATIVGFTIKSYLYCSAIHHATEASSAEELLSLQLILPLLILSATCIIARFFIRKGLRGRNNIAPSS